MRGADRISGQRHPLEHQRGVLLHQVLVDVGARVALVAVGDDELLLARGAARELPLLPAGKPAPPRPRTSAALTSASSSSELSSRDARAADPTSPPARVSTGSSSTLDQTGSRAACSAPASTRSTTPGPASITSPSRIAGEEWQKPRQTVSASETEPSSRRSPSSRPRPLADLVDVRVGRRGEAGGPGADADVAAHRAAAADRRRSSRRRKRPPPGGPSTRRLGGDRHR